MSATEIQMVIVSVVSLAVLSTVSAIAAILLAAQNVAMKMTIRKLEKKAQQGARENND